MGGLFSSSKDKPKPADQRRQAARAQVTDKDRAILDLKVARDKCLKFQKKVSCAARQYPSWRGKVLSPGARAGAGSDNAHTHAVPLHGLPAECADGG